MKAFYILHAAVVIEIILAICLAIKINLFIQKIILLGLEIKRKSASKISEIQQLRQHCENFNTKFSQKFTGAFNLVKTLIGNLLVQGFIKRYLPKLVFISKLSPFKSILFWFLVTFFFFRKKNA